MKFIKPELIINGKDYSNDLKGKSIEQAILYIREDLALNYGDNLSIKSAYFDDIEQKVTYDHKNEYYDINFLSELLKQNILDLENDWIVRFTLPKKELDQNIACDYNYNIIDLVCNDNSCLTVQLTTREENFNDTNIKINIDSLFKEEEVSFELSYKREKGNNLSLKVYNPELYTNQTISLEKFITEYNCNVEKQGTLSLDNSIISGFDATSYAKLPYNFMIDDNVKTFEIQWRFNVPVFNNAIRFFGKDILNTASCNLTTGISSSKIILYVSSNNTSWDVCNGVVGKTTLTANTWYTANLKYDGANYTLDVTPDDGDVVQEINVANTNYPYTREDCNTIFGKHSTYVYDWQLDLNNTYIKINNEFVWEGLNKNELHPIKIYLGQKSKYSVPAANCYIAGNLKEEHGKLSDFQTYNWAGIDPWNPEDKDWEFVIGCDLNTNGNNTLIGNTTNAASGGGFMLTTTSNELIFDGTNNGSSWTKATFNTGLLCTEDSHWIKIKRSSDENIEYRTKILKILNDYKNRLYEDTFDVAFGYAPAFTVMYCNKATYYRIKGFTNEEHQAEINVEIDLLTAKIADYEMQLDTLDVEGLFTWDADYNISPFVSHSLTSDQIQAISLCEQLHDLTLQKKEQEAFLTFIKQSNFFMFLASTDDQTYPNYNTVALMKTGIQELHSHDTINTLEVTTTANYDKLLIEDANNTLLKTDAFKYSFHWAAFDEPDKWYDGAYFYSGNNMSPYTQQMRFGLTNRSNPWQGNIYLEKAYLKIGEEIVWKGLTELDEYNTETVVNIDKNPTVANSCIQVNNTEMSGFAAAIYGIIPTIKTPTSSMEWMLHYRSPKTAVAYSLLDHHGSYKGLIIRIPSSGIIQCWLSNTGSSWNVMNDKRSTLKIPFDTDVSMRITWNGSTYNIDVKTKEQDEWINYITLDNELPINYETKDGQGIGGGDNSNYFNGGIYYLEDCYLNIDDERVWSGITYIKDYGTEKPELTIKDVETTDVVIKEFIEHKETIPYIIDENVEIEKIKNNLITYLENKNLYISDDGTDIDPTYQWASTEQFNQVFDGKSFDEVKQINFDNLKWTLKYGTLTCGADLYGTTKLRTGILTTMSRKNGAELPFIFDVTEGQTWEAVFRAMCITYSNTRDVVLGNGLSNTDYNNFAIQWGGSRAVLWMSTKMTAEDIVNGVSGVNPINVYEFRYIKVCYDGWNYYWEWSIDGENWIRDYCVENQHGFMALDPFPLTLGDEYNSTRACDAIDLQNCYFKINDKYIWKGCPDKDKNNTKLYIHNDVTLQDNKFSNFTTTNYIRMFVPQVINSCKIEMDFHTPETVTGTANLFGSCYQDVHTPKAYLYNNNIYMGFPTASHAWMPATLPNWSFKLDTDYHIEITWDGLTYTYKIKENGIALETKTGDLDTLGWDQDLTIGLNANANPWYSNGYIDLSTFKVYINGELYCNGQDLIDYSNKYDAQIRGKITRNNNYFVNSQHGYWNAIGVSNDLFYERGSQHICKEKYDRNAINVPETVSSLYTYLRQKNNLSLADVSGKCKPDSKTHINTQWTDAKTALNANKVISTSGVMTLFNNDISGKIVKDFAYWIWPDEVEEGQTATTGTFAIYLHYIEEAEERELIKQEWFDYITEQGLFVSEDGSDVWESNQWINQTEWDNYFKNTAIGTLQTTNPEDKTWTLKNGTKKEAVPGGGSLTSCSVGTNYLFGMSDGFYNFRYVENTFPATKIRGIPTTTKHASTYSSYEEHLKTITNHLVGVTVDGYPTPEDSSLIEIIKNNLEEWTYTWAPTIITVSTGNVIDVLNNNGFELTSTLNSLLDKTYTINSAIVVTCINPNNDKYVRMFYANCDSGGGR